ncbi:MAG: hypothetical protein Q8P27_01030 [Candidatus Peregrinibacteria bacterium]|nr:hypothetical protein [Candidatus Peregrinibacteria bacterium]
MKSSKIVIIGATIALLAFLSGCGEAKKYTITEYEADPTLSVLEMKTYDPNSEYFTVRFDEEVWEVQEWPSEEALNEVVLVHKDFMDEARMCYILPGTIGSGHEEGATIFQTQIAIQHYSAQTLEITSQAGISLQYVVGYEVEEIPYVFEVNLAKDRQACIDAANEVILSFSIPSYEAKLAAAEEVAEEETESMEESTESEEEVATDEETIDEESIDEVATDEESTESEEVATEE